MLAAVFHWPPSELRAMAFEDVLDWLAEAQAIERARAGLS